MSEITFRRGDDSERKLGQLQWGVTLPCYGSRNREDKDIASDVSHKSVEVIPRGTFVVVGPTDAFLLGDERLNQIVQRRAPIGGVVTDVERDDLGQLHAEVSDLLKGVEQFSFAVE